MDNLSVSQPMNHIVFPQTLPAQYQPNLNQSYVNIGYDQTIFSQFHQFPMASYYQQPYNIVVRQVPTQPPMNITYSQSLPFVPQQSYGELNNVSNYSASNERISPTTLPSITSSSSGEVQAERIKSRRRKGRPGNWGWIKFLEEYRKFRDSIKLEIDPRVVDAIKGLKDVVNPDLRQVCETIKHLFPKELLMVYNSIVHLEVPSNIIQHSVFR